MMRPLLPFLLVCGLVLLTLSGTAQIRVYGMVQVNDSTLMDQTEVTVGAWSNYMASAGEPASPDPAVLAELPYGYLFDTMHGKNLRELKAWAGGLRVVIQIREDSLATKDQRLRARSYLNHPIAGITHAQAVAYCKWRSEKLALRLERTGNDSISVQVELPTRELYATLLTLRDSTNGQCAIFNYACEPCGIKTAGRAAFIRPGKQITPADSYMPDSLGLYNLRGNAAEMTSTPGVAKGGAYLHPARAAWPMEEQRYSAPAAWLGFRCVGRIRR